MATINAKFAGTCKSCSGRFPAGTLIRWTREDGATHLTLGECQTAQAPRTAVSSVKPTVNLKAVADFLLGARAKGLQWPKARFLAPGGELRLSLAGAQSKNPGAIYVKLNDDYVGAVRPDGSVTGDLAQCRAALVPTLQAIADAPAAAAQAYGALTCSCSFCHLPLTDAGSVEVGYGPICADRYGLPWKKGGAPIVPAPVARPSLLALASQLEAHA